MIVKGHTLSLSPSPSPLPPLSSCTITSPSLPNRTSHASHQSPPHTVVWTTPSSSLPRVVPTSCLPRRSHDHLAPMLLVITPCTSHMVRTIPHLLHRHTPFMSPSSIISPHAACDHPMHIPHGPDHPSSPPSSYPFHVSLVDHLAPMLLVITPCTSHIVRTIPHLLHRRTPFMSPSSIISPPCCS